MRIFNFLKSNNDKHKSLRVKTNIGDKFINVELGQTYESLDILSLKLFQKDLYRLFDADYGVIVGRVTGSGVGLPNCRVSVFIPIDETEIDNPTTLEDIKKIETLALYPYQTVFDKDENGKIYNLLPKYSRNRNFNDFPDNEFGIGATPKTPVGTLPEKEEILTNETVAYVYEKYLKFSTVTNESGDYILTVPSNRTYTVTMCTDTTDIGKFSTTPALLKLEGYPDSFFLDEGTRINDQLPLETLPNIDIQNISINVNPLWSQDETNTNVGINRLDFKLTKKIRPFVTIFGNYFTPGNRTWWGDRIIFRLYFAFINLCIGGCRADTYIANNANFAIYLAGSICINAYVLTWSTTFEYNKDTGNPPGVGCNSINLCIQVKNIIPFIRFRLLQDLYCTLNGGRADYEAFHIIYYGGLNRCKFEEQNYLESIPDDLFIQSHIKGNLDVKVFSIKNTIDESTAEILNNDSTSNTDTIYDTYSYDDDIEFVDNRGYVLYQNNGSFVTLLNCNRNKVVTNENGDLIPVDENSQTGVFTGFRGYLYMTNDAVIDNPPTRNRTGKIALKIPQSVEYGPIYEIPSLTELKYPNQKKWIWKHQKFEAGKIYSVSQYIYVKRAGMSTNDEQKEDIDSTVNIFDPLSWKYLFDDDAQGNGFEEQTNIIYFGSRDKEETQYVTNNTLDNVAYQRNFNYNVLYSDMYNHITIPGRDLDPNTAPTLFQGGGQGNSDFAPQTPELSGYTQTSISPNNAYAVGGSPYSILYTIHTQKFYKSTNGFISSTLDVWDTKYYNETFDTIFLYIPNINDFNIGTVSDNIPNLSYKLICGTGKFNPFVNSTTINGEKVFREGTFSQLQAQNLVTAGTSTTSLAFSIPKWSYSEINTFIKDNFELWYGNDFYPSTYGQYFDNIGQASQSGEDGTTYFTPKPSRYNFGVKTKLRLEVTLSVPNRPSTKIYSIPRDFGLRVENVTDYKLGVNVGDF